MNQTKPTADASQRKSPAPTASPGAAPLRPPEHGLKCPRCDSPNTKFCYYNNYSLTQPRFFCKTCRRYWTKGGALRNVPVGGGCRKAKKSKPMPAAAASSTALRLPTNPTEPAAGLKFFDGLSAAAMDLQLGVLPFPKLHSAASGLFGGGQLASLGDLSRSSANPVMGFNYPVYSEVNVSSSSPLNGNGNGSRIASCIESLSSINQELHWKLQQQRLAMMIEEEGHKESGTASLPAAFLESQQPEIVSFQLPEAVSKAGSDASASTAWFLDSNYTSGTANNNTSNSGHSGTGNWSGVQTWNDMHQFTALP